MLIKFDKTVKKLFLEVKPGGRLGVKVQTLYCEYIHLFINNLVRNCSEHLMIIDLMNNVQPSTKRIV